MAYSGREMGEIYMKIVIDIDDNLPETVKVVLLNMLWAVTQGWSEMAKGNFTARHNGGRKLSQSANNKWDEWDEPRWE
jgi:hypothetical protein